MIAAASGVPGAKTGSGVAQRLISLMPPHDVYIEAFYGGGAIMRTKRPARHNIALDLDPAAVDRARADLARLAGVRALAPVRAGVWSSTDRERRVWEVRHVDAVAWVREDLPGPGTLLYCDPPYLGETRTSGRLYAHELVSSRDHVRLLRVLLSLGCMWMISGYPSELYARELGGGCPVVTYNTMTHGGVRQESAWMNYPAPVELHDYRFLGDGFRERERIRRKVKRWAGKLAAMPVLERQALAAAMAEVASAASAAGAKKGARR